MLLPLRLPQPHVERYVPFTLRLRYVDLVDLLLRCVDLRLTGLRCASPSLYTFGTLLRWFDLITTLPRWRSVVGLRLIPHWPAVARYVTRLVDRLRCVYVTLRLLICFTHFIYPVG